MTRRRRHGETGGSSQQSKRTHTQTSSSSSPHQANTTDETQLINLSNLDNSSSLDSTTSQQLSVAKKVRPDRDMPCQKILTQETPRNIIHILDKSLFHGRRVQSVTNLPDIVLELFLKDLKTHDYPLLIKRLDQLSVTIHMREDSKEYKELVETLKEIEIRLVFYHQAGDLADRMQFRDEFDLEIVDQKSAQAFQQYNGLKILKRILLLSFVFPADHSHFDREFISSMPTSKLVKLKSWYCGKNGETDSSDEFKRVLNELESEPILKIKFKCINMLNRLVCLPKIGKSIAHDLIYIDNRHLSDKKKDLTSNYDTVFLQYLFTMFLFDQIRNQVSQLLESIILYVPTIDLRAIPNLGFIIERINHEGLLSLCKIFAVALSNLETNEKVVLYVNPSSEQQQSTNDSTSSSMDISAIREANQEYLVRIPNLVRRLVELVNISNYEMPYKGLQCELERWIRAIDEALSDDDQDDSSDMPTEGGGGGGSATGQNLNRTIDIYQNNPGLVSANRLNNFVYALYTLNMLLVGKEKKRVIKILINENFSSVLNSLFDHLIWICRCEAVNNQTSQPSNQDTQQQDQINNPGNHICPEISIKIQLLRVLHTLLDEFDFKRMLLSKEELEEINSYESRAPECLRSSASNEDAFIMERFLCSDRGPGLITKITTVTKQQPHTAKFRFWLVRCIESFIRFQPSYADRLFITKRGMIEDMVQTILALNVMHSKDLLQICFDLLGELLKFNPEGFRILDEQLAKPENFRSFMFIISKNYAGTNLFIRYTMLSAKFFELHALDLNFNHSNLVIDHFNEIENQISVLFRYVKYISKSNIGPDNISCLNTAIVILVLARQKNMLPVYLAELKKKVDEFRTTLDLYSGNSYCLLSCFKNLLKFWLTYYFERGDASDFNKLESSSLITVDTWKSTVELLLSEDNDDETTNSTLSHFIKIRPTSSELASSSRTLDIEDMDS